MAPQEQVRVRRADELRDRSHTCKHSVSRSFIHALQRHQPRCCKRTDLATEVAPAKPRVGALLHDKMASPSPYVNNRLKLLELSARDPSSRIAGVQQYEDAVLRTVLLDSHHRVTTLRHHLPPSLQYLACSKDLNEYQNDFSRAELQVCVSHASRRVSDPLIDLIRLDGVPLEESHIDLDCAGVYGRKESRRSIR